MSLVKLTGQTIGKVTLLIVGYLITAGPYYTTLDAFRDTCVSNGGAELLTLVSWVYGTFYYGYPSVIVFGIVFVFYSFIMKLRRRYYATEEVYSYGY